MTQLKTFEKDYEGSIAEKFNDWVKKHSNYVVTHITATDSASSGGSRNKTLYVVFETNEGVKL